MDPQADKDRPTSRVVSTNSPQHCTEPAPVHSCPQRLSVHAPTFVPSSNGDSNAPVNQTPDTGGGGGGDWWECCASNAVDRALKGAPGRPGVDLKVWTMMGKPSVIAWNAWNWLQQRAGGMTRPSWSTLSHVCEAWHLDFTAHALLSRDRTTRNWLVHSATSSRLYTFSLFTAVSSTSVSSRPGKRLMTTPKTCGSCFTEPMLIHMAVVRRKPWGGVSSLISLLLG